MDPTLDFDLIGFPGMQKAKLSPRAIPAVRLKRRILIVRTANGNLALPSRMAAGRCCERPEQNSAGLLGRSRSRLVVR